MVTINDLNHVRHPEHIKYDELCICPECMDICMALADRFIKEFKHD